MGITDFLCNCEYGLPLWAAEAIVNMRCLYKNPTRIHLYIPYENQAS